MLSPLWANQNREVKKCLADPPHAPPFPKYLNNCGGNGYRFLHFQMTFHIYPLYGLERKGKTEARRRRKDLSKATPTVGKEPEARLRRKTSALYNCLKPYELVDQRGAEGNQAAGWGKEIDGLRTGEGKTQKGPRGLRGVKCNDRMQPRVAQ